MTLLELVKSGGIPHNPNKNIVLADGSFDLKADSEVKVVHFNQVDENQIFLSCTKFYAMFADKTGVAYSEATEKQKEDGLNIILKEWGGINTVTPKVSFKEGV